jgi:hypothetical protein
MQQLCVRPFLMHPPWCLTRQARCLTWIAMGPLGWARLGGLTDLAQRPLFPFGNAVNANGTSNPGTFEIAGLGLTAVVTPGITTGDYYVGNELGIEAYEYTLPHP